MDLDTNKSTQSGSLEPLNTGGSLHVTHSAHESGVNLILRASNSNKRAYIGCLLSGVAIFIISMYMLFVVGDVFAAFALLVGGVTLIGLGALVKKSSKEYTFIQSEKRLIGLESSIAFNDIAKVELLKKIINAKTQEEPFQSGEIRILTTQGKRYLLVEGANSKQMKAIATLISQHIKVPLDIDETLHRV